MASYSRYASDDIAISTDKITTNTWSEDTNKLVTFFTSSVQANYTSSNSQGQFFLDVYKTEDPAGSQTTSSAEFSVAYGHKAGSGSENFTNTTGSLGNTATKCVYNQYRQLVYGDELSNFSFNNYEPDDIYVINVNRENYKHALKPGSLNIKLVGSETIELTDDSTTTSGSATITNMGRQFNLVSGSGGVMSGSELNQTPEKSGSFGFFYPEAGVIVFNAEALRNVDAANYLKGGSTSTEKRNQQFFDNIKTGANFELDSEEKISSQYFFTRVKNSEFNYSSNPSYIDTNGNLNNTTMADSPLTYVTTVGLYNDNNNLIAVAKLSQPLKKDFTTEALIRVKLDY
jgi:hypothetical protein